jgi:hypothetical protein
MVALDQARRFVGQQKRVLMIGAPTMRTLNS